MPNSANGHVASCAERSGPKRLRVGQWMRSGAEHPRPHGPPSCTSNLLNRNTLFDRRGCAQTLQHLPEIATPRLQDNIGLGMVGSGTVLCLVCKIRPIDAQAQAGLNGIEHTTVPRCLWKRALVVPPMLLSQGSDGQRDSIDERKSAMRFFAPLGTRHRFRNLAICPAGQLTCT